MTAGLKSVFNGHSDKVVVGASLGVILTFASIVYSAGKLSERVEANSSSIVELREQDKADRMELLAELRALRAEVIQAVRSKP